MNRVIRFYDYEQCFAHYTRRIVNIRQAKIRGEVMVAKPVLLQNRAWRARLRDYIIEHKLTDDRWRGLLAAEGLDAIAAWLLVA